MKRQKRERLEIIKEILGIILLNRNIKSTRLQQVANLSPLMFKEYRDKLLNLGLINIAADFKKNLNGDPKGQIHKVFNLTELGRQYLEDYKVVDNFLEKYGLNEE